MFTLIAVLASILNLNAGCEHKTDVFTCNYFSPCEWKNDRCVFGKRHLNSDRDFYALDSHGTPKLSSSQ